MYYRGAAAAIVVYDITSRASFQRAKSWIKELQTQAKQDIVIALAGNKVDLAEDRQVDYEEGKAYADESNAQFMETSVRRHLRSLPVRPTSAHPSAHPHHRPRRTTT